MIDVRQERKQISTAQYDLVPPLALKVACYQRRRRPALGRKHGSIGPTEREAMVIWLRQRRNTERVGNVFARSGVGEQLLHSPRRHHLQLGGFGKEAGVVSETALGTERTYFYRKSIVCLPDRSVDVSL